MRTAIDFYNEAAEMIFQADPKVKTLQIDQADANMMVDELEKALGVLFPTTYRLFLRDFGCLTLFFSHVFPEIYGIDGSDILDNSHLNVYRITIDSRNSGLPNSLIEIYSLGDWRFMINTAIKDENNESPIVVYEWQELTNEDINKLEVVAPSFGEILYRIVLQSVNPDEFERQGLSY